MKSDNAFQSNNICKYRMIYDQGLIHLIKRLRSHILISRIVKDGPVKGNIRNINWSKYITQFEESYYLELGEKLELPLHHTMRHTSTRIWDSSTKGIYRETNNISSIQTLLIKATKASLYHWIKFNQIIIAYLYMYLSVA